MHVFTSLNNHFSATVNTNITSQFTLHGGSGMAQVRIEPPEPFHFRNLDDW